MGAFGRWRRGNKFHGSSFLLIFSFLCEMVLDEVKHIYKNTTFHKMNIYCKRGKRSQLQLKKRKEKKKQTLRCFFFFHLLLSDIISTAITFKNARTRGHWFIITRKQPAISLPYLSDWFPTSFWQPIYQFISPTSSQSLLAAKYKIQIQCYTDTRHSKPM